MPFALLTYTMRRQLFDLLIVIDFAEQVDVEKRVIMDKCDVMVLNT